MTRSGELLRGSKVKDGEGAAMEGMPTSVDKSVCTSCGASKFVGTLSVAGGGGDMVPNLHFISGAAVVPVSVVVALPRRSSSSFVFFLSFSSFFESFSFSAGDPPVGLPFPTDFFWTVLTRAGTPTPLSTPIAIVNGFFFSFSFSSSVSFLTDGPILFDSDEVTSMLPKTIFSLVGSAGPSFVAEGGGSIWETPFTPAGTDPLFIAAASPKWWIVDDGGRC